MNFSLTYPSSNKKTGPIAVSMTARESCAPTCLLAGEGCYADNFQVRIWWDRVTAGTHGFTFEEFLKRLWRLPSYVFYRHNVAGDLPHNMGEITADAVAALVRAVRHLRASWTYTHHLRTTHNREVIKASNADGFTINCSTESRAEAARLHKEGFPSVCVVTEDAPRVFEYDDVRFVQCPATLPGSTVQCATCGGNNAAPLCAQAQRNCVVTFPVHGARKARAAVSCS